MRAARLHLGIFHLAPRGTPRAAIDTVNAAMRKVLTSPEAVAWLADQANEPAVESPEEFAGFLQAEREKWMPVVRDAGVRGANVRAAAAAKRASAA